MAAVVVAVGVVAADAKATVVDTTDVTVYSGIGVAVLWWLLQQLLKWLL